MAVLIIANFKFASEAKRKDTQKIKLTQYFPNLQYSNITLLQELYSKLSGGYMCTREASELYLDLMTGLRLILRFSSYCFAAFCHVCTSALVSKKMTENKIE